MFCSQIFKFCCDIQGSHLIGFLWVPLIVDQSECLICFFLCTEFTLFCTELTLFCTELPENCIYLNQSELSNFSMYIIKYKIIYVLSSFHLELWLEWLKDEIPLACIPEQREKVAALFERAVKDYQCKFIYNSTYLPCNICCWDCAKSSHILMNRTLPETWKIKHHCM